MNFPGNKNELPGLGIVPHQHLSEMHVMMWGRVGFPIVKKTRLQKAASRNYPNSGCVDSNGKTFSQFTHFSCWRNPCPNSIWLTCPYCTHSFTKPKLRSNGLWRSIEVVNRSSAGFTRRASRVAADISRRDEKFGIPLVLNAWLRQGKKGRGAIMK